MKYFFAFLISILIFLSYPLILNYFLYEWVCYEAQERGELTYTFEKNDKEYVVYFISHCKLIIPPDNL